MQPLTWCRERTLVAGSPLAATLPFAAAAHRDRILVLRCLAAELAAAASAPEIAPARLAWWRDALADEASPHPLLQALEQTGARQDLDMAEMISLVDAVAAAADTPRFERFDALWTHCCSMGGLVHRLEAKLVEREDGQLAAVEIQGAAHYLLRVVRDLVLDARANRWLVPLDFQADYQLSRQDLLSESVGPAFCGLVRAMLAEAVGRGQRALHTLNAAQRRRQVHLAASWALDLRLARQIDSKPARLLRERVLPSHWGNVWYAWRAARAALRA
ncbi:MAG: squalene/phytoene synthase family protein [Wenzhouxiangella sp.]|nr:squalene/phytoene synthase family protein [Wenzhouxiangella sp.]